MSLLFLLGGEPELLHRRNLYTVIIPSYQTVRDACPLSFLLLLLRLFVSNPFPAAMFNQKPLTP